MSSRDEYLRKMQLKLEEWNAERFCPGIPGEKGDLQDRGADLGRTGPDSGALVAGLLCCRDRKVAEAATGVIRRFLGLWLDILNGYGYHPKLFPPAQLIERTYLYAPHSSCVRPQK